MLVTISSRFNTFCISIILFQLRQEENVELRSSDAAQTVSASTAPHPLPMPEYGGYFAPLTEFLPDVSLPISGFHRYVLVVFN